ncbi:glucosylceramide transporter ABCA12 [Osmerus mordax]|uniref:glucosylceramide transporter ABCA12 n=1 Tax=Osmerus mordax TaxID=8014 RepID=UPI0035107744
MSISHFILDPSQGTATLWPSFENMTVETIAQITNQMESLLQSLVPLILEEEQSMTATIPSLEIFNDINTIIVDILTGQADQPTWDKLQRILGDLLLTVRGSSCWDSVPPAVSVMRGVVGALVQNLKAETDLLISFQIPLTTLISEIVHSVNASQLNIADVLEQMSHAIQNTVESTIQDNASNEALECRNVLEVWDQVREAAGLSTDTLEMWCNISLLPVIKSFEASNQLFATLNNNMTGMAMAAGSVNGTAAGIVAALRSFYWVNANLTRVSEQLTSVLLYHFTQLGEVVVSPATQAQWNAMFLGMQLRQSMEGIRLALEQMEALDPSIQPYTKPLEMAINYTMENGHLLQNTTSAQNLIMQVLEILLTGTNLPSDTLSSILNSGLFSGPESNSIDGLIKDVVKQVIQMQMLGDVPMVYGVMEQLLAAKDTSLILEKVLEFGVWWGSTQASGVDLVSQTLPRMYEVVKALLSTLTQMGVPLPIDSNMFVDLAGNLLMMLRQIASSSNVLGPMDQYLSQIQDEMGLRTLTRRTRRQAMWEPRREPMDDFIDLFYIDYASLFRALSVPPTFPEIMETSHMFLANPDLAVVVKGVTWDLTMNSSQDEAIDTALGVLSFLTLPTQWKIYESLFVELGKESWSLESLANMDKLTVGLGRIVDVAMVLSQQPSVNIAQRVGHIVEQLSDSIAQIVSGQGQGQNVAVNFLSAVNNILSENLMEVTDVAPKVTAIISHILNTVTRPEAQMTLAPYLLALDQTIDTFSSYLSAEDLVYFNTSGQMLKGLALLVAFPRDLEKMVQASHIISNSLDHLLTFKGETTLPNGQSIQTITHPLILNSALATQVLWNLTDANLTFSNDQEKEAMVKKTFRALVVLLPEDQRIYILPLEQHLLSALSGVSNTAQIPPAFLGISSQVTMSILAMLNMTHTPVSQDIGIRDMVQVLSVVSQQVSMSLWQGLMTPTSATHIPSVFMSLNQAVRTLMPLLPAEGQKYLNVSLHVLEITATSLNYSAATGDIEGAMNVVASSIQTLLASVSAPGLESTGSIVGDLEHTIQKLLLVLQSGQQPLAQAVDITQLLLQSVHTLLGQANGSMEANLAQVVLQGVNINTGHLLMINDTNWTHKLSIVLLDIADRVPEDLPFAPLIKNITRGLAAESHENLALLQRAIQSGHLLINTTWTDENFSRILNQMLSTVCAIEKMGSIQQLLQSMSVSQGLLCETVLPVTQAMYELTKNLVQDSSNLYDALFETFIGDPMTYNVQTNWTSMFSDAFGLNVSSLMELNINMTGLGVAKVSEILRNKTAFLLDIQTHTDIPIQAVELLIDTNLPSSNLQILSWLVNMHYCDNPASLTLNLTDQVIFRMFCSLPPVQWYNFIVLMARHINLESVIYRLVLSSDLQSVVGIMLQMAKFLIDMMGKLLPSINRLQDYLLSIGDLNLVANTEFRGLVLGKRSVMSSKATFTTVSKAVCNHGIMSLLGISKLPLMDASDPSTQQYHKIDDLVEKFKIPRDATPFCMSLYLDMVNTTGGAIAWAFLKPMLLGQVLYSPDTPLTRAIIQKSNATLQQFANLKMYSEDWLQSSSFIMQSAKILTQTLPMLQNSLSIPFVKAFIESQTNINVGNMKDTLSSFSNMTTLLERNKPIVQQITTLSSLMKNLSSCINFDRYRAYNSSKDLNTVAEKLAKTRDLYASVIFKLPKDGASSRKRRDTSGQILPPKVGYTIRMHIDNSMRTDRTRTPFWIRSAQIWPQALRYTRGFVYLQETIERAIIETQTGRKIAEPAVQVQAFPYPCYYRDEYLESLAFALPLVLMLSWVLFIADFVKKLVHERELRLHEYMKMMGVSPTSHFFAWFLESATFLLITISILTIILKAGHVLPKSDGLLIFLYLCDYGLSIIAMSFLISSFFDKTNIAGLSGSLIYIICFFPYIVVMSMESSLTAAAKNALSLFAPTCFSYASQYITRYENQEQGIQWSNSYISPMPGDSASFGWMCWLLLIDSALYFLIGAYIRTVFPGKYGIAAPWYFPVLPSFWADVLCCWGRRPDSTGKGLLFTNIMQRNQPVFSTDKEEGKSGLSHHVDEEFSDLPVGVALHGLTKIYGQQAAIQNLNLSFYEGHATALLGHNGAGKTTTMSLLTGLFAPSSGTIEVYGRDMQSNIDQVRKELGVCMQYDVHFDHLTTKEHLLLYGQIKAPHWSQKELQEQVHKTLQETGMYAHRHKRVGTLSGGMKRKLSISIAFIGGSRLVVLDEPTTGVDPCSRRSIWDIVIQHKKDRTIILSTHHLDEAEVLSDRIAFLERGGLKCCGSPFYLKDKLAQGYNLTLTKKVQEPGSKVQFNSAEVRTFIQQHVPEARLKEGEVGDVVYSLPPFTSDTASAYRSLLSALDANLDSLQLGCYGISDTTLEEVFLQLTRDNLEPEDDQLWSVSESVPEASPSVDSLPEDLSDSGSSFGDKASLTGSSTVHGLALVWQQILAMLMKRIHHSRRDWKGLISQVVLPVMFVMLAMGLGSIKSDLQHFPEMELSPVLYNVGPQYTFFSNHNSDSSKLVDTMMAYPGIDNGCLGSPDNPVCSRNAQPDTWETKGNSSDVFEPCKCAHQEQVCPNHQYQPPHKKLPSSQIAYNLTGLNVESYLLSTANNFIRDRYGGWSFGQPLPTSLQMDLLEVPKNRTLSKVWYNPEGHHTIPAYLNSLNNFILRSSLPAAKDPQQYGISVFSHPYPGKVDEEDTMIRGMVHILLALCMLTGFSIVTASFVIYEVQEHHTGSKGLQHIAGIGEPFYWTINFLYDMTLYMVPVTLSLAVMAAFGLPAFTEQQNLGAVTILLVLFGFATFPWMYLLSSVFKDPEMAFISYVSINLLISINTIISTSIVYFLGELNKNDENIQQVYRTMSYVFLIFPQFSFGNGLMELARIDMQVQVLNAFGIDAYKSPYAMDTIGPMFISLFLQGITFFSLRLLLNKWLIRRVRLLICRRKTVQPAGTEDEDEDVQAEYRRVTSGSARSDLLQVNQLSKIYQHLSKKVHAVKRLCVGIPAGECFGLLGVNGAGKTTTFKMLTGDVSPTDGTAQIKDWDGRMVDIIDCRNEGINIGYCPQVDALDDLLTGEEHLYFYARIRGISKREIDRVVNHLLQKLELNYHRRKITDSYSCGTRRKLSTALALIGHPQILLLDEPSSGLDPRSKRHLWKIISEEVKGKCAVVLTSHSMEECEALCTRLAIMVKGQFRCLGSLQHIKNRFGSGFTVKMYLKMYLCNVEVLTNFMQQHFPNTYLKDQHSNMVEYHVPIAPGGVADIFDQLESNKATLQIKHFSVSQTTLDEVFINFAMGKVGMETIPLDNEGSEDSSSLDSIEAVDT